MDNANGNENSASMTSIDVKPAGSGSGTASGAPGIEQNPGRATRATSAMRRSAIAPSHVHGSVLEGGDSPAVLAQPAAVTVQGQGSAFHPDRRTARAAKAAMATRRAKRAIADARDSVSRRYRHASDSTDDFVHDNPWKSIALAAVGGLIVGLLASR